MQVNTIFLQIQVSDVVGMLEYLQNHVGPAFIHKIVA